MTTYPDMDRAAFVAALHDAPGFWDFIVIGGGATGLGTAVEAASRGYRTLLLEQHDFAKGTSSRSTKLVHGGVRYLQQGNVSLVLEALRERGHLLRNAPHLVRNMSFVVPCYGWWERPFYGFGLKLYDRLAGRLGLGPSRLLSADEARAHLPAIAPDGLRGGVLYHDGQFDDSRLAVNLAQTAVAHGAVVLNYAPVVGLRKRNGRVCGVVVRDLESGAEWELDARVVINATGVFADAVRRMDEPDGRPMLRPSQGIHLVLDRSFLPGETALMVPRTDDGRVLFAVPWHERVVVGTTDTELDEISLEPRPLEEEIGFLLAHAGRYLVRAPQRGDVLSVFAGLRPLVAAGRNGDTSAISRDHVLRISRSGLVTITGGKWTTYRKMGEDTVDQGAKVAGLDARPSRTRELRVHGWLAHTDPSDDLAVYGSDAPAVHRLLHEVDGGEALLHPRLPYRCGEVVWAARREMARTVEDVLARRTRALLLDARASLEAAPTVATILAAELQRDAAWQHDQVAAFARIARTYLLDPVPERPLRATHAASR